MPSFILKQLETRRNLCRKLVTRIQNNYHFDHDLIESTLKELKKQIILIQNLDQECLEECGKEEDLGKDIVVASAFHIEENKAIAQVKLTESARLSTTITPNTKLPILELKVFSGNLLEWINFLDIFKANIQNRGDLAPIQRFLYLRSQGLPITDASYTEDIDLLKSTYGRQKPKITHPCTTPRRVCGKDS